MLLVNVNLGAHIRRNASGLAYVRCPAWASHAAGVSREGPWSPRALASGGHHSGSRAQNQREGCWLGSSQHVLTLSNPIPVSQLVELSLKDPFLSPPHPQQLSSQEILDALAGPVTADLSRVVLLQGLLPAGENAHGA